MECRIKCGDDGKDDILASTDFDSIEEITELNRACGCKLTETNSPRVFKQPSYDPVCLSLEYYFLEASETRVICRDCKDHLLANPFEFGGSVRPLQFKHEHVLFDNMYPGNDDYDWVDSIPEDLGPQVIYDECAGSYNLPPLHKEAYPLILLKCNYNECRKPFYTFFHDCDECVRDETMDMGFIESDDDSVLESDMEYFRQINNVTPVDKMIKPNFLNSHITDSELRMRVREYESNEQLTPNRRTDFDLRLEQDFLEYNGYF